MLVAAILTTASSKNMILNENHDEQLVIETKQRAKADKQAIENTKSADASKLRLAHGTFKNISDRQQAKSDLLRLKTEQDKKAKLKAKADALAKQKKEIENKKVVATQNTTTTTKYTYYTSNNSAQQVQPQISLKQFMFNGVVHYNGLKFTFYSSSVLPGGGLQIPGRHINANGYVADKDGYIVAANDAPKGTVFNTPFGAPAKVYDRGTYGNHVDIYIR